MRSAFWAFPSFFDLEIALMTYDNDDGSRSEEVCLCPRRFRHAASNTYRVVTEIIRFDFHVSGLVKLPHFVKVRLCLVTATSCARPRPRIEYRVVSHDVWGNRRVIRIKHFLQEPFGPPRPQSSLPARRPGGYESIVTIPIRFQMVLAASRALPHDVEQGVRSFS